ncbi:hypothetical protein BJY52DRAFT_1224051 [Lactarius psammicola]|nr:hypothetical protein BJY52DRAFT_1224051 [Lactarius psammicola]
MYQYVQSYEFNSGPLSALGPRHQRELRSPPARVSLEWRVVAWRSAAEFQRRWASSPTLASEERLACTPRWAGVVLASEQSYCNGIQNDNFQTQMCCQGNPNEWYGGPALLDLYNFTGTYPIGASVVTVVDGRTSRGCYSDSTSSRTLEQCVGAGNVTWNLEWSRVMPGNARRLTTGVPAWSGCGNGIKSPGVPISQSACNQALY